MKQQKPAVSRIHRSEEELATIARIGVMASKRTGNILPRRMYELAGMPVPPGATNELQRKS